MWDTRCEKNFLLLAYLLMTFSDFKFFSDDNSVLFQLIPLQDLHGVCRFFFELHALMRFPRYETSCNYN